MSSLYLAKHLASATPKEEAVALLEGPSVREKETMKLRTASESVGWLNSVGPLDVSPTFGDRNVHQDPPVQGEVAQEKVNERAGSAQAFTRDTEKSHGLTDTGKSDSSTSPSPIGSITRVIPPEALDARLAAIREREQKATKGPWKAVFDSCAKCGGEWDVYEIPGGAHAKFYRTEDAEFIAHTRSDIPWLLALVQALLAERDASLTSVGSRLRISDPREER
jgi:hypothetical protein